MVRFACQTGFPALDAKEPIPQGIKILWMKRPEESLDYAVARVLMRSRYRRRREDPLKPLTVIFCALGLTRDSILYFQGIRPKIGRTVYVLHGASDPAISALIAPQTACQIGERLAMEGEEVLLVIHDMRIFYNALEPDESLRRVDARGDGELIQAAIRARSVMVSTPAR